MTKFQTHKWNSRRTRWNFMKFRSLSTYCNTFKNSYKNWCLAWSSKTRFWAHPEHNLLKFCSSKRIFYSMLCREIVKISFALFVDPSALPFALRATSTPSSNPVHIQFTCHCACFSCWPIMIAEFIYNEQILSALPRLLMPLADTEHWHGQRKLPCTKFYYFWIWCLYDRESLIQ